MRLRAPGTFVADLHVHSRFAIGCARSLTVQQLALWGRRKGVDLLATGDFTHPLWSGELRASLSARGDGLYQLDGQLFVLGTEVSCVFRQGGRARRVHLLVLVPEWRAVDRLTNGLQRFGRIDSDGRPQTRLSCRELVALALDSHPEAIVIPAHIWTPWYSMFGSKSGFDSLEECFGDMTGEIQAVETGLSSDPAMNARVPTLAQTVSVSFSDAHSPDRIGREATVFSGELSWAGLRRAIENQSVAMTIEVFPEHGKYHLDGHRACGVRCLPAESNQRGGRCPVCGRPLTQGVLGRVEVLSSTGEPEGVPRPFAKTLPLDEIVSVVAGRGPRTRTVQRTVEHLWQVAPELDLLLETPLDAIETEAGVELARVLGAVRRGEVEVEPGYDGVYGRLMVPNP